MEKLSILVVDDHANIRKTISYCLAAEGYSVIAVSSSSEALEEIRHRYFDIMFLDLKLGDEYGMDLISPCLEIAPWMKIIIITAHGTIESAVDAMKKGAKDYIEKPFTARQIRSVTSRMQEIIALEQKLNSLKEFTHAIEPEMLFDSRNPGMKRLFDTAKTAAESEAVVLLTGESGTGKSVIAQAIHQWSSRRDKPFGVISCPSVPSELLESELFGHAKGAFTGAVKEQPGRITYCEGGTLFLDEIAELQSSLQSKLLRFIQEKRYERIGDPAVRRADIRIIAATNADLEENIRQGLFREDLYYRLNVISLHIPPLRERREDILQLAKTYLQHISSVNHKPITGFTQSAETALLNHVWPGNLRELRNVIERAVILSHSQAIDTPDLFPQTAPEKPPLGVGDEISLSQIEERHIRKILSKTTSLHQAASILGIDQATLWRKRRQYGIS